MISVILGSSLLSGVSYAISDVPYYHWAEQSVKRMMSKGVIAGYPDDTFKPDNNSTREEVSKMISSYIGGSYSGPSVFSDVDQSTWGYNYINHLASNKIISGYSDGTFNPKSNLTRAEFSTIIYKYLNSEGKLNKEENPIFLSDIDSSWAKDYIQKIANLGYLKG